MRCCVTWCVPVSIAVTLAVGHSAVAQELQPPTPKKSTWMAAESGGTSTAVHAVSAGASPAPRAGWHYVRDAGVVYQRGDFRWTLWGFAERHWGVGGDANHAAFWRRVRQGMEFDFPRIATTLAGHAVRPVFVYEVDLTDNNFFGTGSKWKVWENLYLALQDASDPSALRIVVGQNTHILAYEDNLSSGNLPTINRSLVLEEHGSTNSFGTQWGVQVTKALTRTLSLALSAQDNRGSFNTEQPRYQIGNSLAAKLTAVVLNDSVGHRRLVAGTGVDHTRRITDRSFTLASAIQSSPLGSTEATGSKLTGEAFVVYTGALSVTGAHPFTLESEGLWSNYSATGTSVRGGYLQLQVSVFDATETGDLDSFLRYDMVRLSRASVSADAAWQTAIRAGFNYNLPYTNKLANLHVEAAWNRVYGPAAIVTNVRAFREVTVGIRLNATRYVRH